MFRLRNKKIIFLLHTLNQKLVIYKISQKFTTDLMLFVVCLIWVFMSHQQSFSYIDIDIENLFNIEYDKHQT